MKILFVFLLTLLVFSCHKKHTQKEPNSFKDIFLHKKCLSINKVLVEDSIRIDDNSVIYLYHGLDCYTCIKRGFEITHKIDSLGHQQKVFVVGVAGNIGQEQTSFKYYNYIYQDNRDFIRKELKYLPTPIMLLINSDKEILNIIQPGDSSDEEVEEFIKGISFKK